MGLVSISTFLVDGQSERQMLETEIIFLLHFFIFIFANLYLRALFRNVPSVLMSPS